MTQNRTTPSRGRVAGLKDRAVEENRPKPKRTPDDKAGSSTELEVASKSRWRCRMRKLLDSRTAMEAFIGEITPDLYDFSPAGGGYLTLGTVEGSFAESPNLAGASPAGQSPRSRR